MTHRELLADVKKTILSVEPSAEVLLYGSRARGDATTESDWDFLVLVEGPVNEERKRILRHRLYEIEWASGEVISAIIQHRDEWNQPLMQVTPFHQRVTREGLAV